MGARPLLVDLFCGAGGAAMGYFRAGFDVVGVDIKPQPRYPFPFYLADAMEVPLTGAAVVHASPPCQGYSATARLSGRAFGGLVEPLRARLQAWGGVYVIENVVGAPLVRSLMLCGGMFGLRSYRHRWFESNVYLLGQPHPKHTIRVSKMGVRRRAQWDAGLHALVVGHCGTFHGPTSMGIDWMRAYELAQAIPPAFTEYIGSQLMAQIPDSITAHASWQSWFGDLTGVLQAPRQAVVP